MAVWVRFRFSFSDASRPKSIFHRKKVDSEILFCLQKFFFHSAAAAMIKKFNNELFWMESRPILRPICGLYYKNTLSLRTYYIALRCRERFMINKCCNASFRFRGHWVVMKTWLFKTLSVCYFHCECYWSQPIAKSITEIIITPSLEVKHHSWCLIEFSLN